MTITGEDQVSFNLRLGEQDLADEIEAWLAEHGATDVTRRTERGVFPLLPIVITGILAAGGLTALIFWIRAKTQCQLVIDARQETIRKEIDCRIRDGRIIVLAKDNVKVHIIDAPPVLDFTEVMKAALSSGADAVGKAAQAAGAIVQYER